MSSPKTTKNLDRSLDEVIEEKEHQGKSKSGSDRESGGGGGGGGSGSDRSSRRERSRAAPYDTKNSNNNRNRFRDSNNSSRNYMDRDNSSFINSRNSGSGNNGGGTGSSNAAYVHPASFQQFPPPYPIINSLVVPPSTMRKVIKVSAKSNVKSVAGAISHTTRAGESPTIVATGSESVNQAIKALAIARGYLAENKLDVSCQPVFRNQEKGALSFVLTKSALRPKKPDEDIQELRVAKGSDPNSVAGSIANKIRSNERVVILSIGAGSVNQTVRAVALARRFLEGDAIDLCFRPEFIHIKLDDGERSAIKFVILAQQI